MHIPNKTREKKRGNKLKSSNIFNKYEKIGSKLVKNSITKHVSQKAAA